MFEWLQGEIYVKDIFQEYKKARYCKIIKINGIEIKDINKKIETITPHENRVVLKQRIPDYLTSPDLLYGLNIIDNKDEINITFEDKDEKQFDINIKAVKSKNINKNQWLGYSDKNIPLYMQNNEENYWFKYLEDSKTIYLKYNLCFTMENKSVEDLCKEVFDVVDNNSIDKFIIDLRDNPGGAERVIIPLFKEILNRDYINKLHKFYVIIGKRTASSAMINSIQLKEMSNGIFVGEPTLGKPNHYGAITKFILPNYKLELSCSTKYGELSKIFKCISKDDKSLIPDVIVENSIEDYINGRDAVLDSILRIEE